MLLSRTELMGWGVAVLLVCCMGAVVAHGPFHARFTSNPSGRTYTSPNQASSHSLTIYTAAGKEIGRYSPATLHVHPGDSIVVQNSSNAPHSVTAKDGTFNLRLISPGGSASLPAPTKKGTYPYICIFHQYMKGTIVVQ